MKPRTRALVLAWALIAPVAPAVCAPPGPDVGLPTIAVLELATKDLDREAMLQYIDLVAGALFRTGACTVVDGVRRDAALREIEFSASAAADRASQLEAGRMLAASYVVAGSLGDYDGKVVASLRVVETATGKVAGSSDELYDGMDELFEDAESLALAAVRPLFRARTRAEEAPPVAAARPTGPAEDPGAGDIGIKAPPFSPLQISIFAPLQLVPAKTAVYGLRIGVGYARNSSVIGLDMGLVNRVDGEAWGVQTAVVNSAGGTLGFQVGVVGYARTARIVQANSAYNGAGSLLGLQLGVVNVADKCLGAQVGLVNVAGILKGVQIGAVNIVRFGEWAGFMPFVNVRF